MRASKLGHVPGLATPRPGPHQSACRAGADGQRAVCRGRGYVGGWANMTNPDVKPTGIYGCLHDCADRRKLFFP